MSEKPDQPKSDTQIIQQFKNADKVAANELIGRFFERAVQAATRRIGDRRLRATGPEDIAVSVFESLWRRADEDFFAEDKLTDSSEFWRLLCTMIRYKTEDHFRKESAQKRGGEIVRGESLFRTSDHDRNPGLAGMAGNEFAAGELAAFADYHRHMMDVLPNETLQEVVTMRLENHTVLEIADHFQKSDRWVKRKLALIREIWSEELKDSEGQ